jgi:hypothetical protein
MLRFQELFQSYTGAHGRFRITGHDERGKATGIARTATGAPTDNDWAGHLSGKGEGLGSIALLDDNINLMWAAIDIDKYPIDYKALEHDIENLPLTITKSKSGGAHLWVFLKEPTNAKLVVTKMAEWAAALGHGGCEVFPKQVARLAGQDKGNWINMPYFGDTRRCYFEGQEVSVEKFLEVAEARRVTAAILNKLNVVEDASGEAFKDGPPCLQVISAMGGAKPGERNAFLFAVGVYLRLKFPDTWQEELRKYNETQCTPPLPWKEVETVTGSLNKKDYRYTCNTQPLVSHCNRAMCCKRQFGIAQEGNNELNVTLNGLTKIMTQPPRWLINIDGVRVELDTLDLIEQMRFKKFAVETVNKLPLKIKDPIWTALVQDLMNKVEIVEAPPEASPEGQFLEFVTRFVEQNCQTDSRDMLLNGRVFLEGNFAYFRSSDLFAYLKRERFTDIKTQQMYTILNKVGLERDRFNCKGATVAYWKLDTTRVQALQDKAFEAPTFENPFGEEQK